MDEDGKDKIQGLLPSKHQHPNKPVWNKSFLCHINRCEEVKEAGQFQWLAISRFEYV